MCPFHFALRSQSCTLLFIYNYAFHILHSLPHLSTFLANTGSLQYVKYDLIWILGKAQIQGGHGKNNKEGVNIFNCALYIEEDRGFGSKARVGYESQNGGLNLNSTNNESAVHEICKSYL